MRDWLAVLIALILLVLSPLISPSAASSPASISGADVIEVNATFPSLLNITFYMPRVVPYNESYEAIAPIDVSNCNPPFFTLFVKNLTLYGEISNEVDYFEVVLYDASSKLPVLSLVGSCSAGSMSPIPLIAKYYKSSIELLLDGKKEAEVELRVGKILYTDCYITGCTSISEEPLSSSPGTFKVVFRRSAGEEQNPEASTVTVTNTVTKTLYLETTITETVTVAKPTTITKAITKTKTYIKTYNIITTTTITEREPLETRVETVTKTLYKTLHPITSTIAVVTQVARKPESLLAELAVSLIALVVSFTAFAVTVKNSGE